MYIRVCLLPHYVPQPLFFLLASKYEVYRSSRQPANFAFVEVEMLRDEVIFVG